MSRRCPGDAGNRNLLRGLEPNCNPVKYSIRSDYLQSQKSVAARLPKVPLEYASERLCLKHLQKVGVAFRGFGKGPEKYDETFEFSIYLYSHEIYDLNEAKL